MEYEWKFRQVEQRKQFAWTSGNNLIVQKEQSNQAKVNNLIVPLYHNRVE